MESVKRSMMRAGLTTTGVLLLTIAHRVYGAFVYRRPWRLHIAFVAEPASVPEDAVKPRWAVCGKLHMRRIRVDRDPGVDWPPYSDLSRGAGRPPGLLSGP